RTVYNFAGSVGSCSTACNFDVVFHRARIGFTGDSPRGCESEAKIQIVSRPINLNQSKPEHCTFLYRALVWAVDYLPTINFVNHKKSGSQRGHLHGDHLAGIATQSKTVTAQSLHCVFLRFSDVDVACTEPCFEPLRSASFVKPFTASVVPPPTLFRRFGCRSFFESSPSIQTEIPGCLARTVR